MAVTRRLEERVGSPLPGAGLLQERQPERVIGKDRFAIHVSRSFAEAAPFWQAFEAEGAAYANQTYAWCSTWHETIGRAANIQPHLVQVTSDDGRPAMLLPFGLQKRGVWAFSIFSMGGSPIIIRRCSGRISPPPSPARALPRFGRRS